jgi:hypothetical protein
MTAVAFTGPALPARVFKLAAATELLFVTVTLTAAPTAGELAERSKLEIESEIEKTALPSASKADFAFEAVNICTVIRIP